ncbi:LysR substrate-binding domain-containing protein [Ferrimonas sp. YFM]|uniref:LysR substrate-binding domain-containing protein n=1 Tax=Ferrimonas sp. YFM TaxID=3028878 RepID=UPI0025724C82|nr:LysR substrate-binding domain-containing protein [Ferrimonas sp. YFM]BDY07103.1 LysR family transcriptional regulator [Ferrimonas sp. YFM]
MTLLTDTGRISLKMLRYFDGVARHLHFGRAAEELCISKSALSTQIRELEQILGTTLLSREQKRVTLTETGRLLQQECGQLLTAMERSLNEVRQAERARGHSLSIGIISSALWDGLFDAIERLRQQCPELSIQFLELAPSEQRQALMDRKIDLGLCRIGDRVAMSPLQVKPVLEEPLWAALWQDHPLAGESEVSLRQLDRQPLVGFDPEHSGTTASLMEQCRLTGISLPLRFKVREPQTMMAFVGAGQAVAVVPECFRRQHWHRVCFLPLRESLAADLCVVFDSAAGHPLLQSFIQALEAQRS